jgi:putative methyltransferase (TIGR04325 family)
VQVWHLHLVNLYIYSLRLVKRVLNLKVSWLGAAMGHSCVEVTSDDDPAVVMEYEWCDIGSRNPFEHPLWLDLERKKVEFSLERLVRGEFVPDEHLSVLNEELERISNTSGGLRILDIGGGVGQSVPFIIDLNPIYTVVDGVDNCRVGRRLFEKHNCVNFLCDIPDGVEVDAVVVNGALQYIKGWRELIGFIATLQPKLVFLGRVPMGGSKVISGRQHIRVGGRSPIYLGTVSRWLFTLGAIENAMVANGYSLHRSIHVCKTVPDENYNEQPEYEIRSLTFTRAVGNDLQL